MKLQSSAEAPREEDLSAQTGVVVNGEADGMALANRT